MKIYSGKNKKSAKEITAKELIFSLLKIKGAKIDRDRFSDDSSSWIYIRQELEKKVVDIELHFEPENDNMIESIGVWEFNYLVDEDNGRRIVS